MSETFGERFRRLRKTNGYKSAQDLGKTIGVSFQTISKWENDASLPATDLCIRLAELFDVSIDYLLCISDYKRPKNADIGEITGLSEKSIDVLSRFHYEDEYIFKENLKGLNYILESLYDAYEGIPYDVPINEKDNPTVFEHHDKLDELNFSRGKEYYLSIASYTGSYFEEKEHKKSECRKGVMHFIIPRKETLLSGIYKYTHIQEYQNTEEFKGMYRNYDFLYTHSLSPEDIWYALHMQNIQETLNEDRQTIQP